MDPLSREEILVRVRVRIVAYAASRVRSERAEDIAQETLMLIETRYSHVHDEPDLTKVGLKIAYYKVLESRRGPRIEGFADGPESEGAAPPVHPGLSPEELALVAQLKRQMANLSPECRDMWRYHLEGVDYDQIQRITGVNKNALFQRWRRCRLALREMVNPKGGRS